MLHTALFALALSAIVVTSEISVNKEEYNEVSKIVSDETEELEETGRVVNGNDAEQGQFPWTVALYFDGKFVCTGSIISNNSILTAAHCVNFNGVTPNPNNFYAVAGSVNRYDPQAMRIEFSQITPHPGYLETVSHDVAVLTTSKPIEFGKLVKPVCLAPDYSPGLFGFFNQKLVAMGWGRTSRHSEGENTVEILQYSKQRTVSNIKCRVFFLGASVPDSILCATGTGLFSGICKGDSGGALVYLGRNQEPAQVAVASFVNSVTGCGVGPAGFERVSSYMDFIMGVAQGKVCVV